MGAFLHTQQNSPDLLALFRELKNLRTQDPYWAESWSQEQSLRLLRVCGASPGRGTGLCLGADPPWVNL